MPTTDDDRLARLPAWARAEVTRLRAEVERLSLTLAEHLGTDEHDPAALAGRAYAVGLRDGATWVLPGRGEVRYQIGRSWNGYVAATIEEGRLNLRTGGGALVLRPVVSNVVTATIAED